jgi:hypothetical protein
VTLANRAKSTCCEPFIEMRLHYILYTKVTLRAVEISTHGTSTMYSGAHAGASSSNTTSLKK